MSDDLITLRDSELNEQLREAWDDGFAEGHDAGQGREYITNPYSRARCEWPGGCALYAQDGKCVCEHHAAVVATLLRPRED